MRLTSLKALIMIEIIENIKNNAFRGFQFINSLNIKMNCNSSDKNVNYMPK